MTPSRDVELVRLAEELHDAHGVLSVDRLDDDLHLQTAKEVVDRTSRRLELSALHLAAIETMTRAVFGGERELIERAAVVECGDVLHRIARDLDDGDFRCLLANPFSFDGVVIE